MKGTAKNRWVHGFVIGTFVSLYFMVSIISTIHVIDFFKLSNPTWLAISLAVAFEIGAAASLAAIVILEKTSRFMVWSLFLILTAMQAMGNTYYAFTNLAEFQGWIELFGLVESEPIVQKRILSIVSGAILPIVALGFIKSLVDYIRPEEPQKTPYVSDDALGFLGEEIKKKEPSIEKPSPEVKEVIKVELKNPKEEVQEIPKEVIMEELEKEEVDDFQFDDDIQEEDEGERFAKGIDNFIEVLEEEEEEEAALEELENDIIADKEAISPDNLLQQVPTPHLPENQEKHIVIEKNFGKKPESLTRERIDFLKNNLILVGSTGENMKNEQYVPKSEIHRLKLTLEEFQYLNKVAGHSETTGITDKEIENALGFSQLKGIARDVGMEERITEKDKNQFKGNI